MGEKKSSHKQTLRKERKAKKRAAEDLIPDIPVPEPAFSSSVNEERLLDKKANITELNGNKRKRNRADEEGAEEDNDRKKIDEHKSDEKKKRKRSKKSSSKESKIYDDVENNCESVKKDISKKEEEVEKEQSVKDREKKQKKKGKKEQKTKNHPKLTDVVIDDGEESSSILDKDSTSKKSKKERKAELKTVNSKLGDDDVHDKESEAIVDKNNKVGTNTAGKEISNEDETTTTTTTVTVAAAATLNIEEKTSKTKKDKKKKKISQEQPGETTPTSKSDTSPTKTVVVGKTSGTPLLPLERSSSNAAKSSARFIVFVGNLPYTATTASIMSHFSKLKPVSVRHLTKKEDPSKSRGIAFVEFENYDTHKTALKIMHHSIFDDGQSEPRMINVELTAGGGGNTEDRKAKIKSKNERLNEQRIRRKEEEEKTKIKKEEEKAKLCKVPLSDAAQSSSESNIHPSRRRMITA